MATDQDKSGKKPRKHRHARSFTEAMEQSASERDFTAQAMESADKTATDDGSGGDTSRAMLGTGDTTGSFNVTATTDITHFAESSQIPIEQIAPETVGETRFMLRQEVGRGATGRVFALRDNGLDRTVAVKFLKQGRKTARERFLHEARITATLEHPNIMPVYDIGATDDGRLFFTMKKITGTSLGDVIRAAEAGKPVPEEFRTIDGRVRVFLKVCDALAYAHHRGVVHQDVKPDNIMLGEYGEVLLVDWGSAIRTANAEAGQHLFGTPAYMSPEQARKDRADERSDVYCLGATLFHALILRHPTWAEAAEAFWDKKRRGVIDPLEPDEIRRVPRPLIKIALKAMHAESTQRYQSVSAFADDLKRYQAGLSVSAYRESPLEAFRRWYKRNRRLFWIVALFSAAVSGVGWLLLREKILEMVNWRLFYREEFNYRTTGELAGNWTAYSALDWFTVIEEPFSDSGGWRMRDSALNGFGHSGFNNITFKRRIPGDIRVEWDITPVRRNLNLNCYIAGQTRSDGYTFHVASYGDPRVVVLTKGQAVQRLDNLTLSEGIKVGRRYRMRMEKEGQRVRLWLDGRKLFDYRDPDDISGPGHQTFGFENNNYNHVIIDNVTVYYHPLPLKVSPIATANRFFERGDFATALSEYRELMESYPGRDVAIVSLYKSAICLERLDSVDAAMEAYIKFMRLHPRHELAVLCGAQRGRIIESQGDTAQAEEIYMDLAARFPGHAALRTILFDMSNERNNRLNTLLSTWIRDSADDGSAGRWVEREGRRVQQIGRAFKVPLAGNVFLENVVNELHGRLNLPLADIERMFPEQRERLAVALNDVGQHERVIEHYADLPSEVAAALYAQGRYRQAIRRGSGKRELTARAMLALGHYAAVLKHFPDARPQNCSALVQSGQFETLFRDYSDMSAVCLLTARRLGRLEEIIPRLQMSPLDLALAYQNEMRKPDSAVALFDRNSSGLTIALFVVVAEALRAMGRVDEIYRRYDRKPSMEMALAHTFRTQGRMADAFAKYPLYHEVQRDYLRERGDFEAIIGRFPERESWSVDAMLYMGQYEQILRRWPQRDSLGAEVLGLLGRWAEIPGRYPDVRSAAAEALLKTGKYGDVLTRFADRRDHCARALLAQNLVDSALAVYPESRSQTARYLLDSDRAAEALRFEDQPYEYGQALIASGRPEEILDPQAFVRPNYPDRFDLICQAGLWYWQHPEPRKADSMFSASIHFQYDWPEHRFSRFLLYPILKAMSGDTAGLRLACRNTMDEHMYKYGQRLWFEAAWLAGVVSNEQFLTQPFRHGAAQRLALLKAIRDDIDGRSSEAVRGYRAWLDGRITPVRENLRDLDQAEVLQVFAKGRIAALESR